MFRPFSSLTIAGLILALAAPGAYAQAKGPAKKKAAPPPAAAPVPAPVSSGSGGIGAGDTEVNLFGNLSDHDALGTSVILGVGLGKFVTDNLELKLVQTMFVFDSDAASLFSYSPYVSAEYQIRPSPGTPLVAYVGGGLGMSLITLDTSGYDLFTYSLYLTPVGGFKYFLSERTSLTYALSYQFPLLEEACDAYDCYDSETKTLQNTLGFSIYY